MSPAGPFPWNPNVPLPSNTGSQFFIPGTRAPSGFVNQYGHEQHWQLPYANHVLTSTYPSAHDDMLSTPACFPWVLGHQETSGVQQFHTRSNVLLSGQQAFSMEQFSSVPSSRTCQGSNQVTNSANHAAHQSAHTGFSCNDLDCMDERRLTQHSLAPTFSLHKAASLSDLCLDINPSQALVLQQECIKSSILHSIPARITTEGITHATHSGIAGQGKTTDNPFEAQAIAACKAYKDLCTARTFPKKVQACILQQESPMKHQTVTVDDQVGVNIQDVIQECNALNEVFHAQHGGGLGKQTSEQSECGLSPASSTSSGGNLSAQATPQQGNPAFNVLASPCTEGANQDVTTSTSSTSPASFDGFRTPTSQTGHRHAAPKTRSKLQRVHELRGRLGLYSDLLDFPPTSQSQFVENFRVIHDGFRRQQGLPARSVRIVTQAEIAAGFGYRGTHAATCRHVII